MNLDQLTKRSWIKTDKSVTPASKIAQWRQLNPEADKKQRDRYNAKRREQRRVLREGK
jgi:hypothetical protein